MLTCYLDESGTDSDLPTAVVGGLLLTCSQFFWLDLDWNKVVSRNGIVPPIHMREFTPHGRFASVDADERRVLFADLVRVVNDHKVASIGAVLSSEHYRRIFSGISSLSMYGACFAQATMTNDIIAPRQGYQSTIDYMLDDGNRFKNDIRDAHSVFKSKGVNIGNLEFGDDDSNSALQAADMVSWTVRRCLSSKLPNGFEPLVELLSEHHMEIPYKEEWMQLVADKLKEQGAS